MVIKGPLGYFCSSGVVMETIFPRDIPANSESTQIKSKIPEYAKDFKKEWLFIRWINNTCGGFCKKIRFWWRFI